MFRERCSKITSAPKDNHTASSSCTDYSQITLNGKPVAKIWWMNIGVPETLEITADHFFPLLKKEQKKTVTSTEQTLLYQAEGIDIVILRELPADAVLSDVKTRKGVLPRILYTTEQSSSFIDYTEQILSDSALMQHLKELVTPVASNSLQDAGDTDAASPSFLLMPFKVTPACEELAKKLALPLCGLIPTPAIDINDKIISREICESLGGRVTKGKTCYTKTDVEETLRGYDQEDILVVKEFDGVSGQGFYLIKDEKSKKVFNALLKRHKDTERFRLLVEKWYDRSTDLNYQVYVSSDGALLQTAPSGQLVKDGVYIGTEYDTDSLLTPAMKADLYAFGEKLGRALFQKGYYGNLSMDTIVCGDTLFHLVEINARFSLSTYFWGALKGLENCSNLIKYYNIPSEHFALDAFHNRFRNEGVFILSFGTDEKSGLCRLFLLMSKNNRLERDALQTEVETYLAQA